MSSPAVTETSAVIESYIAAFETVQRQERRQHEPEWLTELRRRGIAHLESAGFPTMRDEDWHFTNVAPIAETAFRPVEAAGRVTKSAVPRFGFGQSDWHRIVFVDGMFAEELSSYAGLPKGAVFTPLARAVREDVKQLVERHLGAIAKPSRDAFTALNLAFMTDGAVLTLKQDVVVDKPIHLLFIASGSAGGTIIAPHNLIVAGHHARASIIESYVSLDHDAYFTTAATEVYLGEGSQLDHYKVQQESGSAFHVGTVEVTQRRDSAFNSFAFAAGGALARTNIYTVLDGEGASATLNGLYVAAGRQHLDQQTRIEHASPNCRSWEVYKGVLDEESHGVFNGKVYVRPEAQKTDGKQSNNNLLLSQQARVDTKPQLEIFADDVKCTHGATVGRLDQQAMFYCESRGISRERARTLLTYAFAADVLEEIPLEPLRHGLEAFVLEQVSNAGPTDSDAISV